MPSYFSLPGNLPLGYHLHPHLCLRVFLSYSERVIVHVQATNVYTGHLIASETKKIAPPSPTYLAETGKSC